MFQDNGDRAKGHDDRLDLGEIWELLRRSRRLLLASMIVTLSLVSVVTLASRMRFRTRGSLYLGELQERAPARLPTPGQWDFMGGESGDVGTEIEILRSQDLIRRAVLESGLNVAVAPAGVPALRYWRWRLSGRDSGWLDAGAGPLAVSNAAVSESDGVDEYRLRMLAGDAYEIWRGGEPLGTGALGREFRGGGLTLKIDPGSAGAPPVGASYTLSVSPVDRVVDQVTKALTISVPKVTTPGDAVKVVALDFVDSSPLRAARFVDALMRVYLDRRQSWKTEEATRAESFVTEQVSGMKQALDDAERKLADYKKGSNVVGLSDEARGMVEQLGKYEEQRMAAQLKVAAFGQVQELLKQEHPPIERYLVGETDDPVLAGLSSNLAVAQQELRKIEDRFTPDAPAAREQQAQVDGQLKMVKDYVLGRSMRAQHQLESLDQMIAQFERKLRTVPSAELDLTQLTRSAEVLSKMYSFLLERQQQAAVTKASTMSRNRILDAALIPYREDSPVLGIRLVAAALLGLLAGALVVLLRRVLAPTFQSERELVRRLADQLGGRRASVLAVVPETRGIATAASAPSTAFAEAFRHLRTNLYLACPGQPPKVLLLSSASPGDGKTLCSHALAAALAADGKHVVLIDADMRRHWADADGNDGGGRGLSDVLAGRCHWSEVVRGTPEDAIKSPIRVGATFDAILAGASVAGPAELLSGPAFGQLLNDLRASYDFVVIDSPPFPLVVDALVISAHADWVLTVLRIGNSFRDAAGAHLQRFGLLDARHGIIINGVPAPRVAGQQGHGAVYAAEDGALAEPDRISAPA